ncbi:four-carbon acid sugar kinase family protein [Salipiger mucosus]|uniref:Putative type III effector Hop protein n=1 Tax=Salipiger mucosus DSM 16094 TaxID=1123237 RepID=S9QI39_9RHOB|nr:four-carbon acid sugar kinase family protein [Salipiger mucosus]EPX79497.1 putative type III effector Hop protein [Salipiger mucosus DSM 16094]
MSLPQGPLVAWYGDDFTGSAATMEALAFAGVPAVLFLDVPTEAQLAHFPEARGIGIASTARTHSPEWMRQHLPDAFDWLRATGAPVVHYKVCSTLDSSPEVGSIGTAIDIGQEIMGGRWVPCLVAAPVMRRYQAFGNLFASAPDGVFRLDRHPVMSRHPVTPMDEADVARHLAQQTDRRLACLDVEALEGDAEAALAALIEGGAEVVTLDAMTEGQMAVNGRLIWQGPGQVLAVGSQGVEYALIAHWREAGLIDEEPTTEGVWPAKRMVAVSGSVSPTTAAQIDWAEANGFEIIPLDAAAVACGDVGAEEAARAAALAALGQGRDPLICSARGPEDPAVARLRETIAAQGIAPEVANERIGAALGRLLAGILRETGLRRAVISGGDTSGHASRQMGLYAFTALAPTIPGAALLVAHSEDPDFDGLQLALKGGQMGSPDYFGWIKRGGGAA